MLVGMWLMWGWKNKHHEDTCSQEIGLHLQIFINYSTLHDDHSQEYMCVQSREINKYALPITIGWINGGPILLQLCSDYFQGTTKLCVCIYLLGPQAFMSPYSFHWVREFNRVRGYYSMVTFLLNRTPICWLVCDWCEDERTNTMTTRVYKGLDYIFKFLLTTPHFITTIVKSTCVFNQEKSTNMHFQ